MRFGSHRQFLKRVQRRRDRVSGPPSAGVASSNKLAEAALEHEATAEALRSYRGDKASTQRDSERGPRIGVGHAVEQVRRASRKLRGRVPPLVSKFSRRAFDVASVATWFMPGLFFLAIGLCALFAPQFMVAAVSAFFVFLGLGFFLLAWRFIQFKRRIEQMARSFEARLVVQGVPVGKVADPSERLSESGAGFSDTPRTDAEGSGTIVTGTMIGGSKKIVFH